MPEKRTVNIITCIGSTTGQSLTQSSNNCWEHISRKDANARSCPCTWRTRALAYALASGRMHAHVNILGIVEIHFVKNRRGPLEPTSVAPEPHTCTGVGRWNPLVWRWNLTPAQAWGAGTCQCGAETSNLHRRGALEPTGVALEPHTCTGVRLWNPGVGRWKPTVWWNLTPA